MRIRNITSLAGALFGIAYTAYGMYGAYRTSDVVQTEGMKLFEGLVLCAFTVPFGALIGFGLGLLLEGAFMSENKNRRVTPKTAEEEEEENRRNDANG